MTYPRGLLVRPGAAGVFGPATGVQSARLKSVLDLAAALGQQWMRGTGIARKLGDRT